MSTTVHVKNISAQTSEKEVRDFFSFCGKISSIEVESNGNTQTAAVTFEKPTAAKTALLLDNTQLGPSLVQVTSSPSSDEETSSDDKTTGGAGFGTSSTGQEQDSDVAQEDKPRSRIIAEYLAHGYTISDGVITRAIDLDSKHGYSNRFTTALQSFDDKYHATDRTKSLDAKYGVSEKAYQGWAGLSSYFEKAMGTPSGQKVREFYGQGQKQVLDVHREARRLADLKGGRTGAEQAEGEKSEGTGEQVPLQHRSTEEKAKLATE